ncbi:MAG TPA: trypsin-like serine protease [Thermoanaerobaculia bacterium]
MASNSLQNLRRALDFVTGTPLAKSLAPQLEGIAPMERPSSWASSPNIQGFGIAERVTQGQKVKELALKVYVERKLPAAQVDALVPAQVKMPGLKEPVYTDVQEIGKVQLEANTARYRPAMPGCGLGHYEVEAGTFGCLVRKKGKPELYVLSNSHVLANEGFCKAGDDVLQFAKHDGGTQPGDVLCQLAEWVPFTFSDDGFDNLVDAAIARVLKPEEVTSAVRMLGVPKGISTVVRRGMQVRKCGRTSDVTIGEITDIDYRLPMTYKTADGAGTGRVGLRDQVLCTRYTAPGDSGSAVFNMDGNIVGLHFAGSPASSIFNRIGNVLDALGLEVVTDAI